ncbi:MAG: protein kinase [bacterium]
MTIADESRAWEVRARPSRIAAGDKADSVKKTHGDFPGDEPGDVSRTGHYCPACHAPIDPAQRDCPECGQRIPVRDPLIGYVFDGRYRVIDVLGRGGMAVVYWADDASVPGGREVALKLLKPDLLQDARAVERFRRESERASQIHHPNAVQVFDHGEFSDGMLFLAMERLRGTPLSELIRQGRGLPEARAVKLLVQIASAVGEAHRIGLVHRDLKPDNVMIEPGSTGQGERAVVLDFGIAKSMRDPHEERRGRLARWLARDTTPARDAAGVPLTRSGYVMGTPDYMSPEQAAGNPIDARSDVFSLGLILFEMLTGELPWEPINDPTTAAAEPIETPRHLRSIAAVRPELTVSADLDRILGMALALDVGWRYPDAQALAQDLDRLRRSSLYEDFKDRTSRVVKERATGSPTRGLTSRTTGVAGKRRARAQPSAVLGMVPRLVGAVVVLAAIGGAGWIAASETARSDALALLARLGWIAEAPSAAPSAPESEQRSTKGGAQVKRTPSQLLADGERALDEHRWEDARARFEEAMDRDRPSARAWLGLARAQIGLGRSDDSQYSFTRALDLLASSTEKGAKARVAEVKQLALKNARLDELPESARRYVALGDTEGAVGAYTEYLEARPWDGGIELRLGMLLARANRLTEAIPHLETAVKLSPDVVEAHLELGMAYSRVKQASDAQRELARALELDPSNAEARRQLEIARRHAPSSP